jgi:hypothetical protein
MKQFAETSKDAAAYKAAEAKQKTLKWKKKLVCWLRQPLLMFWLSFSIRFFKGLIGFLKVPTFTSTS